MLKMSTIGQNTRVQTFA